MSVSVDDKLLGEKSHYYCSSSSEDENEDDTPNDQRQPPQNHDSAYQGKCVNTGPKGVIEDWRKYKQLETENRQSEIAKKEELVKKLSMTCISYLNDDKNEEESGGTSDDFLLKYREQRLAEMKKQFQNVSNFGKVLCLTPEEYTAAVDKEKPNVMIVIHIYEENTQACDSMNGSLTCLAQEYPAIKFCKMRACEAFMSGRFVENGVPALLIYRNKELIGNFVRLSDEFGEDFFATDVESFLVEHGFLPSSDTFTDSRTRKDNRHAHDSDSDFGID